MFAMMFALAAQPLATGAQPQAGAVLPPLVIVQDCGQGDRNGDEIVVCGRRDSEDSPYRIPREFRNQRSDDDAHASWDARWRDEESIGRFSNQNDGPFGYLRRGRQLHCEWLAQRQQRQGRRPDCGRKPRPDGPTDWQRR